MKRLIISVCIVTGCAVEPTAQIESVTKQSDTVEWPQDDSVAMDPSIAPGLPSGDEDVLVAMTSEDQALVQFALDPSGDDPNTDGTCISSQSTFGCGWAEPWEFGAFAVWHCWIYSYESSFECVGYHYARRGVVVRCTSYGRQRC